jgi:adenosylcobinamide-phosphate synthase
MGHRLHPIVGYGVTILLCFWALSGGELARAASRVRRALDGGDSEEALEASLRALVGRKTRGLQVPDKVRATLESVGENTVDGVIAPLFYMVVGGPVWGLALAWGYKAVNTLDSMVGYRNERYERFGWASARLDDLANWLPARLGYLIYPLAGLWGGRSPARVVRTMWRDGRKHPSPNAGISEAALAGALGVQLGGRALYEDGEEERGPFGEPLRPLEPARIPEGVRWMLAVYLLSVGIVLGVWVL